MRARRNATSARRGTLSSVWVTCHGAGGTARDVDEQLRGALHGALLVCWIHAAFESLPGVGDEPVAPPAAGNRGRREVGSLEQHIDCRRGAGGSLRRP